MLVGRSVHTLVWTDISATIGWTIIKFCTYIDVPQEEEFQELQLSPNFSSNASMRLTFFGNILTAARLPWNLV